MISDDSTSDSDSGIRFKTDSTRRPISSSERKNERRERRNEDRKYPNAYKSSDRKGSPRRNRSPIRESRHSRDRNRSDYSYHESSNRERKTLSSNYKSKISGDGYGSRSREIKTRDDQNDFDGLHTKHHDADKKKSHKINKGKLRTEVESSSNRHIDHGDSERNLLTDYIVIDESRKSRSRSRSPIKYKKDYSKHDTRAREEKHKQDSEELDRISKETRLSTEKYEIKDKNKSYNTDEDAKYKKKNVKTESIMMSSSSENEDNLKKKLYLLEEELMKVKNKKKSKHKDKKRDHKIPKLKKSGRHSSDYAENSLTDKDYETNNSNVENINCNEIEDKDESKEEGEILSDSDEKSQNGDSKKQRRSLDKSTLPDLRERLSSKISLKKDTFGPALPPHMINEDIISDNQEEEEVEGPALPPHMLKTSDAPKNIGPNLSDSMRQKLLEDSANIHCISDNDSISEDDVYGPIPQDLEKKSESHKRLEERALMMKINSLEGNTDKPVKKDSREEWMLKLPEAKARNLGLSSRQFKTREGPDFSDRTSWTDTPEQKALKAMGLNLDAESDNQHLLKDAEREFIEQRDIEQESLVKKYKKKNKHKESLLEIHQKKLKKKKKKEEKEKGKLERRPFDRNVDLKANHFDEAQKKLVFKKAQLLDTRFASGESKYL